MPRLERFKEQDIPYDDLAKFGLTQEMIDDLPQSVMIRLLSSRETPLLPLKTKTVDGDDVISFARISLIRTSDGSVNAVFILRWESNDLSEYTPEQQKMLKSGNYTVQEVSDALHFANQSFFGTYFKKAVGLSPKDFIRTYSSGDHGFPQGEPHHPA